LLEAAGVDLVWTPTPEIVYPPDFQTWVTVEEVTKPLEGAQRPGHFRGVATVVAKLFNAFQPHRAYFGQKDAQQMAVIKQMARDLNFSIEVVACPTVREHDGLAMSSRNAYLNAEQRAAAPVLFRALSAAATAYAAGQRDAEGLRQLMAEIIDAEPLARRQYVSCADPATLQELDGPIQRALLSMAVFVGKTRLIDNLLLGDA
jgi:pantoate--beta-alanine ligase